MKLESDAKRVKKLAEERSDENWRFRTFLRKNGDAYDFMLFIGGWM